jgi:hypothetical protein
MHLHLSGFGRIVFKLSREIRVPSRSRQSATSGLRRHPLLEFPRFFPAKSMWSSRNAGSRPVSCSVSPLPKRRGKGLRPRSRHRQPRQLRCAHLPRERDCERHGASARARIGIYDSTGPRDHETPQKNRPVQGAWREATLSSHLHHHPCVSEGDFSIPKIFCVEVFDGKIRGFREQGPFRIHQRGIRIEARINLGMRTPCRRECRGDEHPEWGCSDHR